MLGNEEKCPLPIAKTMTEFIQRVLSPDGNWLAYIIRANFSSNITSFVTPPEHNFQLAFCGSPARRGDTKSFAHNYRPAHFQHFMLVLMFYKILAFNMITESIALTSSDVLSVEALISSKCLKYTSLA